MERITSIRFKNYKAFKSFSVALKEFNVLVGPNNAGKSTVIGAIRILGEAIRKARSRNPELVQFNGKSARGYKVSLAGLAVSTENVFNNYDDTEPAEIVFRVSNGNTLTLVFEAPASCILVPETPRGIRTVGEFKRQFDLSVISVPVLGPVEANEPLYDREAARLALLTHRASRNFRNIWYHFPEEFDEFRTWVQRTWPGMDILKPEVSTQDRKSYLHMFCPEYRIHREIYWAGFGFQVWCQMLTFILQARNASLLIIDEPDIYLHSDLQRQLIRLLEDLGPAILLATHSTEIISEVEADSILHINRKWKSAKRISGSKQLHDIFLALGSRLNPALTELAKTRVVLFLEGQDFKILSRLARKLQLDDISSRSGFVIIPSHGFNPQKVIALAEGMEVPLDLKLFKAVIFDRDYRSEAETEEIRQAFAKQFDIVAIHGCKEIENFLLKPQPLARAIERRMKSQRIPDALSADSVSAVLAKITEELKSEVFGQVCSRQREHFRRTNRTIDDSSVLKDIHEKFETSWRELDERLRVVPGKRVLSLLNDYLQETFSVSVSVSSIADAFETAEVPEEVAAILRKLDGLRVRAAESVAGRG